MDLEVAAVEIRIFLDDEIKDELCMHKGEMQDMPEIAFGVINQRAQQALGGKVLKRITYIDDEGDHCTLGPASIIDSLDLCRGGMLDLFVITEEEPMDQGVDSTVALEVTHSTLKLDAAPFQEGVQAWTDREYKYKKIPDELLGSILYRPSHIVPTNTYFLVQAPAGSAIYIFSETHRDGGFPGLGWQKCEANRFRWEIPGSGKHYALSLWKTISTGEETVIEVFESLVGGIAVKTPVNSNPEAEATEMLQRLMEIVGEENLRTAVRKLGDKGLDLMAEYQDHFTDEWTALVTPLHLAASGDFVETQVNSFVRNALEVYQTLPCALQQTVMKAIKGCLDEIVSQKVASPQFVEIHKNIICDGCEKDPLIGKRFKCTTCRDYDLCETCHNNRHAIHPEHSFYRMPAPFSLELSVVCDGCGKKKIQPEDRFKCTECPDYDLCASCFDDCSRIHPHHSTWEHQGQKVCIASAPPAEPEPETVLNEGDRNVQMESLGSNSVEEEEKLASSPKEVAESVSQEMRLGEKELAERMLEVDPMMNCPCTPDLDLDEIGQANGGATMAPCTPGTPTPLTPPIFQAFAAMACPTTPPQPKMAWVPQPCTPPFSGEEQMNAHEVDPKVAAVAMAKLLSHPNNAIRQAVVQAMSVAEVEVALAPKEESVQDSGSDVSDDWERLDGSSENEDWQMQDTAAATPLPSQPNLVKVLFASTLLSDPTTMQSENKHGVMEFQGTEAYRLGMLEIKHSVSAPTARALVKIVVMNSGKETWPEASNLSLQSGPSWGFDLMPLGAVTPGETVELVLDLSFTAGHQGDTLASAWAVTDGKGEPIGPRMVLEVVRT